MGGKRDSGLARGRLQLEKVQKRVSNTGETREGNSMVCLVPETTIRNIELIFLFFFMLSPRQVEEN